MKSNFDDVGDFHEKFDLQNVTHRGAGPSDKRGVPQSEHYVDEKLVAFRLRFLLEELNEIVEGAGYCVAHVSEPGGRTFLDMAKKPHGVLNHEKVFDGLLDLAYVTFGFAQVMGYPWQEGWDEVQRANISKERCGIDHKFEASHHNDYENCIKCGKPQEQHSLRGSAYDVIKPKGWKAPDIAGILRKWGFK